MLLSIKHASARARSAAAGTLLASALLAQAGAAHALAPEHEVRRLMLATEEAVVAGNWSEAGDYLNRLHAMEGEKPADYFYYRGRAMLQASHLNEARAAFEQYITRVGAEGAHYQQSLKLITDIEKTSRAKVRALTEGATAAEEPVAMIEPAGGNDVATLRRLYLADTDRDALVIHLNALLDTSGWRRDKTVVRLDKPADMQYRVSVDNRELRIQNISHNIDGTTVRTTESLAVFGVNPQLRWDCEAVVATCWVYDPRDGSRLFQLAGNREQAGEIARTMGRLIRNLQHVGNGS
ncbi:hypothetical protein C7H09_18770 [Marinobacter fuscus]|uniref:Tetratricopeptide repeat protein n=1 Tax=Marinobacter fuscus TaxID=2109942 RepID=A0A2T1K4G0_9GAMM|nr:hypothetical protein [Marinobacter fuscus]PSF04643.1 hypothetical protein C7H09_18770 [Marinobacter fuscus]